MKEITLTEDQENVLKVFTNFLVQPDEKYMIIQGSAGTGKSTLIAYLAKIIEAQMDMYALLLQTNKRQSKFEIALTATTNKAVAVLEELTQYPASTIHNLLKLTVRPNFETGQVQLFKRKDYGLIYNKLIIIDEASMINDELFEIIDKTIHNSKVILIGDQYQLAPVKQNKSIMETLDCTKVCMNKVMRHNGIILHTGAQFRESVETGIFNDIPKTHEELIHVSGPVFKQMIEDAFTCEDYHSNSAKVLAWTNQQVHKYNNHIRTIKGYPDTFQVGEIVYTNNPIINGIFMRQTDSQVKITDVGPLIEKQDVEGRMVQLDGKCTAFLPTDQKRVQILLKYLAKEAKAKKYSWIDYYAVKNSWLDLRPSYASTCHKSQGSTYDTVFLDLTDIGKCNISSDVARMLYVGISRASEQVILYGDLPLKYKGVIK